MPILARNETPVTPAYSQASTFYFEREDPEGLAKIFVQVLDNDVIMQVTEHDRLVFENPTDTELKLVKGVHNLAPATPWTAWRFRSLGTSSRVTFRAYT